MGKTASNGNGRAKLADDKIIQAIYTKTPKNLQGKLKRLLKSQIADRQGSLDWQQEHPHAKPVTTAEKIEMAKLHSKHRVSFRALEGIYHLIPNSGMGAYRCVQEGKHLLRQRSAKKSSAKREAVTA